MFVAASACRAADAVVAGREKLRLNDGWKFAFGHPSDTKKDFGHATGYFSYITKTGFGDGAAAPIGKFDDSAWRVLDLSLYKHLGQPMAGIYDPVGLVAASVMLVGGLALCTIGLMRRDIGR